MYVFAHWLLPIFIESVPVVVADNFNDLIRVQNEKYVYVYIFIQHDTT